MLCEISQTEKDRYHMILLILFFTLKKNEHTKQNRNKFIDTQNSLVVTRGEGGCYGDMRVLNEKRIEVDILIWTGIAYTHLEKKVLRFRNRLDMLWRVFYGIDKIS